MGFRFTGRDTAAVAAGHLAGGHERADMTMTEATTYNEFRIETMAPDEDRWHYRHFTGAAGRDFAAVSERLAKARAESAAGAGIRYRLMRRTVLVTTTPWVEHTEVEHVPAPGFGRGQCRVTPGCHPAS
jgi:hypothetical protein